jgi:hypothetical protein
MALTEACHLPLQQMQEGAPLLRSCGMGSRTIAAILPRLLRLGMTISSAIQGVRVILEMDGRNQTSMN